MAVPVDGDVEPVDGLADQVRRALGRRDADRVDDGDLLRARLDRGLVGAAEEVEPCARAVDAEERDRDPLAGSERDRFADPAEHVVVRDPERGQLRVRDRALDHGRSDAKPDELLDVRLHRPRETPDLGAQPGVGDAPDRLLVVGRDAREARLDPVDPGVVERPCDRELVVRREHDADGLLAVAQRRVVEADGVVRLRLEREPVEIAGPDLLAVDHAALTIPSGKRQRRSAPTSVMRKLSSTRRPPPSGQ